MDPASKDEHKASPWAWIILGLIALAFIYKVADSRKGSTTSATASSPAVTVSVGEYMKESSHWRALVAVTNRTNAPFTMIGLQCTWFDGDRAVDTSGKVAMNVAPGETTHEKMIGPYSTKDVSRVDCRVSYANR